MVWEVRIGLNEVSSTLSLTQPGKFMLLLEHSILGVPFLVLFSSYSSSLYSPTSENFRQQMTHSFGLGRD